MFRPVRILIIISLVYCSSFKAQSHYDHYSNFRIIDTNNIQISLNNTGSLEPYWIGGIWTQIPYSIQTILFDQGFWVIGKINNFPHLALNQWTGYYSPGPIINGQAGILVNPQDSLRYRIYKISRGDDNSNPDYAEWPADLGAPVTETGDPKISCTGP